MCMFELADEQATRDRIAAAGVRVVHDTSRPDIVDIHLHPKDVPGAIVALDITDPVGGWRWGGPRWDATIPDHAPGGLRGLTVAVREPDKVAALWASLIGVDADGTTLVLDDGAQQIEFVSAGEDDVERIVAVRAAVDVAPGETTIAGVRFVHEPT